MNTQRPEIINALLNGEAVSMAHPDMPVLTQAASDAFEALKAFNQAHEVPDMRRLFGNVIGQTLHDTTLVYPPFYTNHGKNISIGKGVFINHACSMLDLGGIEIHDDVMIGPRVNITSENHPVAPADRKTLVPGKVVIKKNAWIGAGATILPGVTIGEHSVVAAGAVVTQDIPDNIVAGGVPAKILKDNI